MELVEKVLAAVFFFCVSVVTGVHFVLGLNLTSTF